MTLLSLRARVFLGALLWTVGLVLFAFEMLFWIFWNYPDMPLLGRRGSIHFIWGSHAALLLVVAAAAMVAGALQVRSALTGIGQLRVRLTAVRDGHAPRVEGRYVSEVQPLVDDLNSLLEDRERRVARALAKAGDLAHGLKTPLAVLGQEAERTRAAGQGELAESIAQQVERMRRQVEYHLVHARAAVSGSDPSARCLVLESAEGLSRTLMRLHAGRGMAIDVRVPPDHAVKSTREDLDELLGNLLDNGCKWAKSRVAIESLRRDGRIVITVDDDGPGLPAAMWETVLTRGVRADEAAPGTGLGLAIVRDLADLYGGSIALEGSPLGGLRARLQLPSA